MRTPLLALFLLGCTQSHEFVPGDKDEEEDGDADADSDADSDTDSDADQDGDGFTVEEGDCDDDDIGVNPARDEDASDGQDNDCDGRVDEAWSGLTVGLQSESGRSSLVIFDTVGRESDTIGLDEGCMPFHLDHGLSDNYVAIDHDEYINISSMAPETPEYSSLIEIGTDGTCTELAQFADENYWWGPFVRGVKTHPDGYYVVAGPGVLYKVEQDGSTSELATWNWDYAEADSYEFYAMDLAIDLMTGEIALLDLLGGYATYTEDDGFVIHKQADLSGSWENWDWLVGQSLAAMDGGGFHAMVINWESQEYALRGFDSASGDWVTEMEWADSNIQPLLHTTDGDNGDWYVTAKGGDHRTIWRLRGASGAVDDFYDETEDGYNLWGIVSNY